jgi:hypothetical protein
VNTNSASRWIARGRENAVLLPPDVEGKEEGSVTPEVRGLLPVCISDGESHVEVNHQKVTSVADSAVDRRLLPLPRHATRRGGESIRSRRITTTNTKQVRIVVPLYFSLKTY